MVEGQEGKGLVIRVFSIGEIAEKSNEANKCYRKLHQRDTAHPHKSAEGKECRKQAEDPRKAIIVPNGILETVPKYIEQAKIH